jgi:hypothetical protein
MKYVECSFGSVLAPKLLGTYERELHSTVERIIATPYDVVLDVGAAEGYYAVGLALRMPTTIVHAYDINSIALGTLRELALRNGVAARVAIGHECDHKTIQRLATHRAMLICDIEGDEASLLDPSRAPALSRTDILVEVHDGPMSNEIHDCLVDRFSRTHSITLIPYAGRSAADCPSMPGLRTDTERLAAVEEYRLRGILWAVLWSGESARS